MLGSYTSSKVQEQKRTLSKVSGEQIKNLKVMGSLTRWLSFSQE